MEGIYIFVGFYMRIIVKLKNKIDINCKLKIYLLKNYMKNYTFSVPKNSHYFLLEMSLIKSPLINLIIIYGVYKRKKTKVYISNSRKM